MISPVMEKVNRKNLFMSAATFMGVALSVLASFMPNAEDVAVSEDKTPAYVQLVLPMSVVMFSLCYGAGFGPAIYTWSSELFQPRYKIAHC